MQCAPQQTNTIDSGSQKKMGVHSLSSDRSDSGGSEAADLIARLENGKRIDIASRKMAKNRLEGGHIGRGKG